MGGTREVNKPMKQKRRVRPSWDDLDPFGSWEEFSKKVKKELKKWPIWCGLIHRYCYGNQRDSRNARIALKLFFPMLFGVREWWLLATKGKAEISPAQIALQMQQYSKYSNSSDVVSRIIVLINGKIEEDQDPNKPPPLNNTRSISPLLLADFALSCMYLSSGHQMDFKPQRQGGNIRENIINAELKQWRYEQKCKNIHKAGMLPPDEWWNDIEKNIEYATREASEESWYKFMNLDDERRMYESLICKKTGKLILDE